MQFELAQFNFVTVSSEIHLTNIRYKDFLQQTSKNHLLKSLTIIGELQKVNDHFTTTATSIILM